ncbi:MAG: exopolysaccharide biosynthesis protein [Candidatus Pelagibacter sp.]|nr:exopolysaccharide biosynthesis protein [Candidatus Pelagibacter sp.]|tara:strand:- start:3006 stop:3608 length:603 start_codon:yes stop_codon:yes gene_type:complete
MLKQILDFVISLIIIIILFPVYLFIFFLVFIDSGFPIIHRREVHLSSTKKFKFFKFRTMHVDADKRLNELLRDPIYKKEYDEFSKLKKDPRVTRFGRFLRKTSLDELPQLFNVLFFQMSLVGPRPKTSYELNKYYSNNQIDVIFSVKPGVTGLQQISGRANLPYVERIKIEIDYIKNRSILLDFIILAKTPFALFKGGVY